MYSHVPQALLSTPSLRSYVKIDIDINDVCFHKLYTVPSSAASVLSQLLLLLNVLCCTAGNDM